MICWMLNNCLCEWNSRSVTLAGGGNVLKDRVVGGQAMSLFPSQLLSAVDKRFSQNSRKMFLQLEQHCRQPRLAVTGALIINTISPQAWTDIINIHLRSDISTENPVFTHNAPNQYLSQAATTFSSKPDLIQNFSLSMPKFRFLRRQMS